MGHSFKPDLEGLRKLISEANERSKQRKIKSLVRRKYKKIGSMHLFAPENVLPYPNRDLSVALYKAYHGQCQYCCFAEKLQKGQLNIEHIIPRSFPLELVSERFLALGISSELVTSFCVSFLPPHHNSVLNLIPACIRHNLEKKDSLLHPAVLEFMFIKARRKAKEILEIYSQELHRRQLKDV